MTQSNSKIVSSGLRALITDGYETDTNIVYLVISDDLWSRSLLQTDEQHNLSPRLETLNIYIYINYFAFRITLVNIGAFFNKNILSNHTEWSTNSLQSLRSKFKSHSELLLWPHKCFGLPMCFSGSTSHQLFPNVHIRSRKLDLNWYTNPAETQPSRYGGRGAGYTEVEKHNVINAMIHWVRNGLILACSLRPVLVFHHVTPTHWRNEDLTSS